jgi:uncharacterized protein (TIGR02300 family)
MPAKELGTKHTCFKCGTKFYDFKKPEPICPKCGADQRESPALKAPPPSERRRAAPKPAPVVAEEPEVEAELDEEVPLEDEDAEDDAAADE